MNPKRAGESRGVHVVLASGPIWGEASGGFPILVKAGSGGLGNPLSGSIPGVVVPGKSLIAPIAVHLYARSSLAASSLGGAGNGPLVTEIVSWSGNMVDVRVFGPLTSAVDSNAAGAQAIQQFRGLASGVGLSGATLVIVGLVK